MAYDSLSAYLEELTACGGLARVDVEVSGDGELAEITRRVARAGGPALLFDRVAGHSMAVVTNLLGDAGRVARALAIDTLDEIPLRIEALIREHTPSTWFERLKMTGETGADRLRPKLVKTAACQQVVRLGRDVDVSLLPLSKQSPDDSAPTLTAGRLISQSPGGQQSVASLVALKRIDQASLEVIETGPSSFARLRDDYRSADQAMPVAIALGGDPAGTIAAGFELSANVDFHHLVGLLRGKPADVVKCRTHAIEVPADADVILEGYWEPSPVARCVIQVAAITHRTHPIVPVMVDCGGHAEADVLASARERIVLHSLRRIAPELVELSLPRVGGAIPIALATIRNTQPYLARRVASALWGSTELAGTRFLVLLDGHINPRDTASVLEQIATNVRSAGDIYSYDGPMYDAAAGIALVRHWAVDATAKQVGTQAAAPAADQLKHEIEQLVDRRWSEYQLGDLLTDPKCVAAAAR